MVGQTVSRGDTVLCVQIRVIDKSRVIGTLGRLEDSYMRQIADALSAILGLFQE